MSVLSPAPRPLALASVAGRPMQAWHWLGLAALIAIAAVLPFGLSNYQCFQLTSALVYAIAIMGLNILTGYNGQISLGHGAFFAIGAYIAAILISKFAVNPWLTIPVAAVVCLGAGFLFGLPALRLEGLYLALATFALAVATPQLLKYKHAEGWTGGVQGIVILDKPEAPFGLPISQDRWLYLVTLAIAVVMLIVARNLTRGRVGRAIVAIRDHPIAADTMGVNSALYKSLTFGVSALYTGIAGALSTITVAYVAPDSFDAFLSIRLLVGVVVGGLASISGAIYGGLFIQFMPNFADQISKAAPWAIYGMVLIAFMFAMPTGVAGFVNATLARLTRRWRG